MKMENADEEDVIGDPVDPTGPNHQRSGDLLPTSTRLMRNKAEKMRRDKLNEHITQLASIVPIVSMATKRVDKTSILRLSAAYLRINQNLLNEKPDMSWKPCFLDDGDLSSLLLEAVNGFLLILSTSGKVIYVSDEIEKTLGHSPVDVIGHSMYNILHPDDCALVQENLQVTPENENERRSFYCRLSERTLSRSDCGKYDLVHVLGHIRLMKSPSNGSPSSNNNNNNEISSSIKENLLVCVVRQIRNQAISEISWMDGCPNEYITQHGLDGIIQCVDHRISLITGHTPDEVRGKNAYDFIFAKDIPIATLAHREIFINHTGTTTTIYRLWTRSKKLIYLKTQGRLQQNCLTHKVDNFICVNKLLTDEQGRIELHQLQMRFTPSVNHRPHCDAKCEHVEAEEIETHTSEKEDDDEEKEDLDDSFLTNTRASLLSLMNFLSTSVGKPTRTVSSSSNTNSVSGSLRETTVIAGNKFRRASSLSESAASDDQLSTWSGVLSPPSRVSSTTSEKPTGDEATRRSSSNNTMTEITTDSESDKEKSKCTSSSSPPLSQRSSVPPAAPVVIGRQRRSTRSVGQLPACHTPSHGEVERLFEHRAQSHVSTVPLKRRCSKMVQPAGDIAQPLSKRGRGRPRQNSC